MSAVRFPDVTLAVLAGGQGRRLGGVPKGLIQVGGRTVLERLAELFPLFGETLLIANDPAPWARVPARIVPDARPGHGAPGGLHAALSAANTPWVALLASDMPFVTEPVLSALLARRAEGRAWICTAHEGRLNPMPGVYARALLPELERLLPADPSFRELLERAPGQEVPSEALREVDPALQYVVGINTPEDAERVGAVLPSERK